MRIGRLFIVHLGVLLASIGCSPKAKTGHPDKGGKQQITSTSQDVAKGEQIDIPANIAGSYLTCALRKEAKVSDLEAQYGCRLTDGQTEKKLELAGVDLEWSASVSNGVQVQELSQDPIYHVYYNVSAGSVEAIQTIVRDLEVIASVRYNAGDLIPIKRDKVTAVLKPALVLEDFEAPIVREQTIQPDDSGSL